MRLDWALLAEAARVRDAQAHIIGAGIDMFFPQSSGGDDHSITFELPFKWYAEDDEIGRVHSFDLAISPVGHSDPGKDSTMTATLKVVAGPVVALPPQGTPFYVNSFSIEFKSPRFGKYRAALVHEGKVLKEIDFFVLPHAEAL
jgi:hypothetical protein